MNNLKMKIAGFKSECIILCKDAKKGDEISGIDELISLYFGISGFTKIVVLKNEQHNSFSISDSMLYGWLLK
jgi:hypothetical protein